MTRRVLHAVGGMAHGGVENWLMAVMRRLDPNQYRWDFLVQTDERQAHQDEIEALGGRIIPCLRHRNLWRFAEVFARTVRELGPYDIVHSHVHYFDGVVLRCAARHGVPVRIAQSHIDYRADERGRGWAWRLYFAMMRSWIRRFATLKLAVSPEAAAALFGAGWARRDCLLMPCGLDLSAFEQAADRAAVRAALALPADALVLGNAARLVWEKNHRFVLEVAAAMMAAEPRVRLLVAGDGPLKAALQERARALGIADRTIFAGSRDDVPQLMQAAIDVFVFPSLREGLGVALLEAQAAGLPCIVSDALPTAGLIVPALIHRLSLEAPAEVWAQAALTAARERSVPRAQAFSILRNSAFDIDRSAARLLELYDQALAPERLRVAQA